MECDTLAECNAINSQMGVALTLLGGLLLISFLINIVFLIIRLRSSPSGNPMMSITSSPDLRRLIDGRDPLGNIVKFLYWAEQNRVDVSSAQTATSILLEELERGWGLKCFGEFNSTAPYNPEIHDLKGGSLKSGHIVRITEPGWQLRGKVIKYPEVRIAK
jgi:hypothetical protein